MAHRIGWIEWHIALSGAKPQSGRPPTRVNNLAPLAYWLHDIGIDAGYSS